MTIPNYYPNSEQFAGYGVTHPVLSPANRRGISFPLQVTSDGGLETSEDTNLIRDWIFHLLYTERWERIMRPSFGVPDLTFETRSSFTPVYEAVRQALKQQVERVDEFEVSGEFVAPSTLILQVKWYVSGFMDSAGFELVI